MTRTRRSLRLAGLLVGLTWSVAASAADYLLAKPGPGDRPNGARLQIGTGLPLPVGTDGIFTGGQMMVTGVITTRMGGGMMISTGPALWPPLLLIGPAPGAHTTGNGLTISQNLATPQGGNVVIPASVLANRRTVNDPPRHGGVFNTNPKVYDVATTLSYNWPSVQATFAPGSGPGPLATPIAGPGGGTIDYSGGTKAFGGAAIFKIAAGPNAGTRMIPPNPAGMVPIATVFVNAAGAPPMAAGFAGIVAASDPLGMAAQGASLAAPTYTTMFGPVSAVTNPLRTVNGVGMWTAGSNGTIMGLPMDPTTITTWSVGPGFGALTHNNATTEGFPWTTGLITVAQPAALGGETFYLAGNDGRLASTTSPGMTGAGNLSLVSGALSDRNLSGPNANRAFVSLHLPEPTAALGAAGALAMLALCHGLVRRRSD